jgi:hypothetical protein
MLSNIEITELARGIAREKLTPRRFDDVVVEPKVDWVGNDALRVLLIIPNAAVGRLKGDALSGMLLELSDRLLAAGDERFPYIEFATREELEAVGDPEC